MNETLGSSANTVSSLHRFYSNRVSNQLDYYSRTNTHDIGQEIMMAQMRSFRRSSPHALNLEKFDKANDDEEKVNDNLSTGVPITLNFKAYIDDNDDAVNKSIEQSNDTEKVDFDKQS